MGHQVAERVPSGGARCAVVQRLRQSRLPPGPLRMLRQHLRVCANQQGREKPRLLRDAQLHLLQGGARTRHGNHRLGLEPLLPGVGQEKDLERAWRRLRVVAMQGQVLVPHESALGCLLRPLLGPPREVQGQEPLGVLPLPHRLLPRWGPGVPGWVARQLQARHRLFRRPSPQHGPVEHGVDRAEPELGCGWRRRLQLRQRQSGVRCGRDQRGLQH
mmetsp:Transcript_112140/g.322360  ORF Transcript_112140/g.322360 Transcript_112140/m.322360 type:complete len:216 (+) Transcript_112140:496-1143(+)